jgi:hypothetical protein
MRFAAERRCREQGRGQGTHRKRREDGPQGWGNRGTSSREVYVGRFWEPVSRTACRCRPANPKRPAGKGCCRVGPVLQGSVASPIGKSHAIRHCVGRGRAAHWRQLSVHPPDVQLHRRDCSPARRRRFRDDPSRCNDESAETGDVAKGLLVRLGATHPGRLPDGGVSVRPAAAN